ncbi:putative transcriptional regulatory protein [Lachnellula occidentalis]|uniref:Putative transcriptional regulatory protein n=1 Tax=Lachnellula occidentalis TaxID=215460 RepID=A0A8H8S036_9HELO|nr:putative transcriptional regulatory protein [Lachnellula occidentalis]
MPRATNLRRVANKDRLRVSRACAACRSRKARCVPRRQGSCQRCEATHQACVFEGFSETWKSDSRRSHDRTLSASSQAPDENNEPWAAAWDPSRPQPDAGVRVIGRTVGLSPTESFCSPTRRSRCNSNNPDEENPAVAQYENPTPLLQEPNPASDELEGAILLVEDPGRTHQDPRGSPSVDIEENFDRITSPHYIQSKEVVEALKEFPPQEIAWFLASTFFYYVEATFFYCDREWFYETLTTIYAGNTAKNTTDDAFVCFALLVFAFGSQFADLRSNTKIQDHLPVIIDPGKRFYDIAQTLIPRIIVKCSLKGIQVCLLAGLYNLPSNLPDTSYLYLGMAMRMSIASGLHRKTSATSIDQRLIEVRNRLWWSVYCIDRRTSIALGRPSSIAEEDVDASYPQHHPSLDNLAFGYQSNMQHQIEYIKLTRIVNQIMQRIPLESKPSWISDLSTRLKQWRSNIFSKLHPNDLIPGERNFRTTVHLQVHYHWAWIRMGRASLVRLTREQLYAPSKTSSLDSEQCPNRLNLARLCVDAAKATLQLILVLKKHNLLCRFSFTDHQASTAALVILILNSISQRNDDTTSRIDDGIEMLRYMAYGGCQGAKSDLATVEQFRAFAVSLRQKASTGEAAGQGNEALPLATITTVDSYQTWVKWMSEEKDAKVGVSDTQKGLPKETVLDTTTGETSAGRNIESPVPEVYNSSLDVFYSLEHRMSDANREMNLDGSDPYTASFQGVDWGNSGLDILGLTQLLVGNNYDPEYY